MSEKIEQLPGTKISPETVLCKVLEMIEDIKSITIIVRHNDDFHTCHWSSQQLSDLTFANKMLDIEVTDAINGREPYEST